MLRYNGTSRSSNSCTFHGSCWIREQVSPVWLQYMFVSLEWCNSLKMLGATFYPFYFKYFYQRWLKCFFQFEEGQAWMVFCAYFLHDKMFDKGSMCSAERVNKFYIQPNSIDKPVSSSFGLVGDQHLRFDYFVASHHWCCMEEQLKVCIKLNHCIAMLKKHSSSWINYSFIWTLAQIAGIALLLMNSL